MNTYSITASGRRIARPVLVAAAVVTLAGCIPVDNSFLRTSLYVMALERASHGAALANRVTVQRDDCDRYEQLYFMCRYPELNAFLSPATASSAESGAGVPTVQATTAGRETHNPDIQVAAKGTRIASSAAPVPLAGAALAVRSGTGTGIH